MTIIPFPHLEQGCSCRDPEWLSLPLAPRTFARSRFLGEEKLPEALPLQGAAAWIDGQLAAGGCFAGLDISGPGDPMAAPDLTMDILDYLRQRYGGLPPAITTLGIGLAEYAAQLAQHGVTHITLLVNAVQAETACKLYAWIRPGKKNIPLDRGAAILIEEQKKAVSACREAGMAVTVRSSVYQGVNDYEIEAIARRFGACGVESLTLAPGKGRNDGAEMAPPSPEKMEKLVRAAGRHIRSVTIEAGPEKGNVISIAGSTTTVLPKPTAARPNVAVLSSNGMDIDLHLGQAIRALVYGPREDGLACLLEARELPVPGSGDNRWLQAADILADCFVLLAASAGQRPRDILVRKGLPVVLMEDNVEGTVDALYGGKKRGV